MLLALSAHVKTFLRLDALKLLIQLSFILIGSGCSLVLKFLLGGCEVNRLVFVQILMALLTVQCMIASVIRMLPC